MERRRHFNFTLGHELLCAAGGVVAAPNAVGGGRVAGTALGAAVASCIATDSVFKSC